MLRCPTSLPPLLAGAVRGRKRSALINLLLLLLCSFHSAAHAQYRLDHWTADNGLPQNSVRDIVQTRDGYLWLTTFDGLVRFDGVRFTVFNKSNSLGIANNRFLQLFEDRHGDLWARLETGDLVRRAAEEHGDGGGGSAVKPDCDQLRGQ